MTGTFTILAVCTANICRSPVVEVLLARQVQHLEETGEVPRGAVVVRSAGVKAVPGAPACRPGAQFTDRARDRHQSHELTTEILGKADLVLALARDHAARIARLSPRTRPILFTLRHAAHLGSAVEATLRAGRLPDGAGPLPDDPIARLRWWVGELDAARGLAGSPVAGVGQTADPMDVPDPHESPVDIHDSSYEYIAQASAAIGRQWAGLLAADSAC